MLSISLFVGTDEVKTHAGLAARAFAEKRLAKVIRERNVFVIEDSYRGFTDGIPLSLF